MDVAKLILNYLDVLVWPVVVLAAIVILRKPLVATLNRLKCAHLPGEVTLDFEQTIHEAKRLSNDVEQASPPPASRDRPSIPLTEANARMIHLGLRPSPSGLDMSYYGDLAQRDASLALAGLRMEVEILARNLAQGFKVKINERDSAGALLRKLHSNHSITTEQFQLAMKIVELCNAAVHGYPVTREDAEAVIEVAQVLADQYVAWLSWGFNGGWNPSNPDRE